MGYGSMRTSNENLSGTPSENLSQKEMQIREQGEEIFRLMEGESKSIFNKDWWYGQVMDWSMKNEQFKTQMFRFVDVLPALQSGTAVARHLREYFAKDDGGLPPIMSVGLGVGSLAPGLMANAIKKNVVQMAKMFITGASPEEALPVIMKSRSQNICFTMDLLGEATLSEEEASDYQRRYLSMIQSLSQSAKGWPTLDLIDRDHAGEIPKVNISIKLSSIYSQVNIKAWDLTKETLKERLRPLFKAAKDAGLFVNVDMEQYELKNLTLSVFQELLTEDYFRDYPYFGIVIQAYLRDALTDIEKLANFAKSRGTPFTVRLVKGAYWDFETIVSAQKRWPIPVFTHKAETDANFEACSHLLLKNFPTLRLALASHNIRSLAAAFVEAQRLGIPRKAIEVQMLYGMAEPIKKSLVKLGYRVREYAPVGDLLPGMAYLVRRLLENTSNESFLRSKFVESISNSELLKNPLQGLIPSESKWESSKSEFYNEPLLDFTDPNCRRNLEETLIKLKKEGPKKWPIIVGGEKIFSDRVINSENPSHPSSSVGQICLSDQHHAQRALEKARKSFLGWSRTPVTERTGAISKLADLILANRYPLTALIISETGKPWSEADGDLTEAIDFCRYYALQMEQLAKPRRVGRAPGELSHYRYRPRGVSVVIAPWNFPLAILTGQVAASLVTGNTVIIKPAEQSSVVAAYLMELIQSAGIPVDVVHFLPGLGEEIGEYLVKQTDVDIIAFTGSKEVGLQILRNASQVEPGQRNVKKCIIEMGGKNAIIIDSDADIDEAISGVVYSAFGFQGQKCSACSRVIILEEIYDRFVKRLAEAVKSIPVGFAEKPESMVGPVIDREAYNRINRFIVEAKSQHELILEREVPSEGYFIGPTIFGNVDPKSRLAQEEIFGPVLALIKAKDLDEAIEIANQTVFGLTGGIYSRSPSTIERAKQELEVGNLYINRSITGAMVERHPFGGIKMSGIGSKTGGPDYLLQFLEPICVTENTMRRGFAPQETTEP